jgi:hypothetical protein
MPEFVPQGHQSLPVFVLEIWLVLVLLLSWVYWDNK